MKKFKHLILIGFILVAIPVSAKQLWEYGSFSERANMAVSQGIVDEKSAYKGTYEQNAELLKNITLNDLLGFAPSTGYYETLTTFISKTASTINVSSTDDQDGFELPLSTSNKGYFNLEPGTAREERVVCTGVSGDAFTGCTRGLVASSATNETASTTLQYTHSAGSIIIMTNIAQFFGNYVNIWDAQTVAGIKTFSSLPKVPETTPTDNAEVASWGIISTVALQGAATSTELLGGISELATQIEMASSTNLGADRPLVLQARYASSTGETDGLYVVVSENDGYINQNWLDLSDTFIFSGDNTHSGAETFTGTTTQSGMIIDDHAMYSDGNELNVLDGVATGTVTSTNLNTLTDASDAALLHYHLPTILRTTRTIDAASATVDVAHGLGRTPGFVKVNAIYNDNVDNSPTHDYVFSNGISDGTNNYSTYLYALAGDNPGTNIYSGAGSSATEAVYIQISGSNDNQYMRQEANITLDGTNVSFVWTKTENSTSDKTQSIYIQIEVY